MEGHAHQGAGQRIKVQIGQSTPPKTNGNNNGNGAAKMELASIKAEQMHLLYFIQNTHQLFQHVMFQKERFCYHLQNFGYRVQNFQKFIFGPRLDDLKKIHNGYVSWELKIIFEYFEILWTHHESLRRLTDPEELAKHGYTQMPDLQFVRQIAHELLDRIVEFQIKLFESLVKPLDVMEKELFTHGFNGMTCWESGAGSTYYQQQLLSSSPDFGFGWYQNQDATAAIAQYGSNASADTSTVSTSESENDQKLN